MSDTAVQEPRALRRSRSDRLLAGVCGGLGDYFQIHPAIFRVAFVVLTLASGAGILIYLAALIVMPAHGKEESIFERVVQIVARRPRRPPTVDPATLPPAKPRRLAAALFVTLASLVALAAVAVAALVSIFNVDFSEGIGERKHVITDVEDLRDEYRLGMGELRIDLGDARLPEGVTRFEARVDFGELRVTVPDDVALRVRASAKVGEIRIPGETTEGRGVESQLDESGDRVLSIDARVGLGVILVEREGE